MSIDDNKDGATMEQMLGPRESFFLEQAENGKVDKQKLIEETQKFIEDAGGNLTTDQDALMAFLLHDHLGSHLTEDQRTTLKNLLDKVQFNSPILKSLAWTKGIMQSQVENFFARRINPSDYWEVGDLKHPLANKIAELDSKKLVQKTSEQLKQKGDPRLVIESSRDPKTNRPVIWMSTNGQRYSPAT